MSCSLAIAGSQQLWFIAALGVAGVMLGLAWMRRLAMWRKRILAERQCTESLTCVSCGYDLQGQTIPRCPECGALRGFKVPMDKLGLSEQELRESLARRQAQRAARRDADAGK